MKNKIYIEDRYIPQDEIRKNIKPYEEYYECLKETFDFRSIKSFCDAGCANGPLIYTIKKNNTDIDVLGLEYFSWQKEASDPLIKDNIIVHDLRDKFEGERKYDIVNCTETGEHIDPEYQDIFIDNLKRLCSKYLIISWSNSGGANDLAHDEHEQHLNPLQPYMVEDLLTRHGFTKNKILTQKMISESLKREDFLFWWRHSLGIWEVGL